MKSCCAENMVKFGRSNRRGPASSKLIHKSFTITLHVWHIFAFLVLIIGLFLFNRAFMESSRGGVAPNKHSYFDPDHAYPFNEGNLAAGATHLIIVAGHSVTISGHLQDADADEGDWYLLDYQKGKGLPAAIVAHIKAGIMEASKDPHSLLVFSGGETRGKAGPEAEGASYFRVADAMKLWVDDSTRSRTVTEDFARDSFENLSFSICRFFEVTGHFPTKISFVSFSFKQRRFEQMHAPALRWPTSQFQYIGVDPDRSTGFDLVESTKGENENALTPFETDPYGCNSKPLQEKRHLRNPFSRTAPYDLSCPAMKELLHFCGPELIPKRKVPWG